MYEIAYTGIQILWLENATITAFRMHTFANDEVGRDEVEIILRFDVILNAIRHTEEEVSKQPFGLTRRRVVKLQALEKVCVKMTIFDGERSNPPG